MGADRAILVKTDEQTEPLGVAKAVLAHFDFYIQLLKQNGSMVALSEQV